MATFSRFTSASGCRALHYLFIYFWYYFHISRARFGSSKKKTPQKTKTMLKETCILGILFVLGAQANLFGGLEDPFGHNSWSWRSQYHWPNAERRSGDIEDDTSREPLAPDYKDPETQSSETKPVTQRPSYDPSVIPGGVLDVDASDGFGYPSFPDLQGNFGFGFGGPNRHPQSNAGGLFGLGGFFSTFNEFKPWWKGENVCIDREESTDDEDEAIESKKNETESDKAPNFFSTSISLSNCQHLPHKYECVTKINNHGVVKTFTVRYKCCYGFERSEGASGCTKKVELKSLMETIEHLDGNDFKAMLGMAGVEDKINNENYTVFLPTDAALSEFDEHMSNMNKVEAVRRRRDAVSTSELVRNHIVSGFVDINDLYNDELIFSENNNKSIRINMYPSSTLQRLTTANCVPIKKSNNLAKNGIVHVIDGVIQPASQSIIDLISESSKLTTLKKVLEKTDLSDFFKEDGHYTIFAPTNEAFDKLDAVTRQKLLNGKACAGNILRHHIVKYTICSSAISGNATTHNMVGDILNMERTDENQLIIEGKAKIEKPDVIATNGVIHLIDTVVIPDTAMYLNDALKKNNITKFQELIKSAEFEDDMDGFENATVFAPSNEALEKPEAKEYLEGIMDDKEKLREFIKYHTVQGEIETCNLENNAQLETELEGKTLRVNLYSTLPIFANIVNRATVNCARLTNFDEKSCGSIIHEVDRILLPAEKTIMEIIEDDDKYSTLREIMNGTDIEEILRDESKAISFVAPDNEAFKNIDDADLKTLREDKEKATLVLKNHILSEILCCSGVGPQTFGFNTVIPTLAGQHQQVSRSGNRQVRIGRASVTSCDSNAKNGVVHTINRVLFPQRPPHPHFGFFLFDL